MGRKFQAETQEVGKSRVQEEGEGEGEREANHDVYWRS